MKRGDDVLIHGIMAVGTVTEVIGDVAVVNRGFKEESYPIERLSHVMVIFKEAPTFTLQCARNKLDDMIKERGFD